MLVTFVTLPLPSTVILGTFPELPYVPGEPNTVANVATTEPGPLADTSPVKFEI